MKCPKCNGELILDETKILTSLPPQYEYKCNKCDYIHRTTELDYGSTKHIINNTFDKSFIQQGWECPKCGAVMSPNERCCINCKGYQDWKITWTSGTGNPSLINNNISISSEVKNNEC